MGCGCSKGAVGPVTSEPGSSLHTLPNTCAICGLDGQRKVASWWCEDCKLCICNYCAWNHSTVDATRAHYLVPREIERKPKPLKPAWEKKKPSKIAQLVENFDTRADLHYAETHGSDSWNQTDGPEHERGECLLPVVKGRCCPKRYITQAAAVITSCTFLPGGYIAVTDYLNEQIKLFNEKYKCRSFVKVEGSNPTDICSNGSDIYVTVEDKCKIEKLNLTIPICCMGRKLKKNGFIKTEGYCDSVAICRVSFCFRGLVVGMTFSATYHTKRYQVHILSFSGQTLKTLFYDDSGQTLFHGKVFVCGSPNKGEIYVSDNTGETVQGFNFIKGQGLFRHSIQEPLGLTVDDQKNIYVITHSCFYWITPNREEVIPFLKRGHRSRSHNCCYDNKTKRLALTSSHSETVQLYKIF